MGHTDFPTIPIRSKRILVVDNNSQVLDLIAQYLEIEGYTVYKAQNDEIGLKYINQLTPDLIIADTNSAGSGVNFGFYKTVRKNPLWVTIPFIFLTSTGSPDEIQRGKEMGVEDYLVKPVDPNHLAKIVNARLLRSAELQVALIDQAYLETINVLANTIEGRDPYTHGHVQRVSIYAQLLAEKLGWPRENLRMLAFGARLHDIGKIIVPDEILKKPGGLTPIEWSLMKQHPEAGEKILRNITHLQPAIPYVLHHHERWDGSGYPHNLMGREIPIEGRLLAIVDVYDALSTKRPYHPARPNSEVIEYMKMRAGVHFDPDLAYIFIEVLEEQAKMY